MQDVFSIANFDVDFLSPNCMRALDQTRQHEESLYAGILTFGPVESFMVQILLPLLFAATFWSRYLLHCTIWHRSKNNRLPRWATIIWKMGERMRFVSPLKKSQEEMDAFYDGRPALNQERDEATRDGHSAFLQGSSRSLPQSSW